MDTRSPTRWVDRDAFVLGLLLLSFVVSRLLWLSWNPGTSIYWEESYRWVAAHELLTEPSQSLLAYQADHYQGGSLVMILLVLPFFQLLGESTLTLKLPALLFCCGILSLLYLVGRHYFGRRVGLLAALGYLAGPPLVAYWGLVVMGSHHESNLFSLALMGLLLGLHTGRWRSPWAWALFGVVAGLGAWFCFTAMLSLAACGLAWLLLQGLPRPKEWLSATAGFLVGFVPWLVYNVAFDFPGVVRVLELFGLRNPVDPWVSQTLLEKLESLLTHDLPVGLVTPVAGTFPDGVGMALGIAFCVPVAVALALALARVAGLFRHGLLRASDQAGSDPRRSELVFLIYGGVFLSVFLVSRFTVDPSSGIVSYRLFLAPAVLLLIPAAISVVRGIDAGGWKRSLALGACGLALTSSAVATVGLASGGSDESQTLNIPGGYAVMGLLTHRKYEGNLGQAFSVADRVAHPALRYKVKQGIGWGLEYRYEKSGDLVSLLGELSDLPLKERAPLISGIIWSSTVRRKQVQALLDESGPELPEGRRTRLLRRIVALEHFSRGAWDSLSDALREIPDWDEDSA